MQKYTDVVTSARSGAAIPNARVTVKTYPGAVLATIYSDDGITTQTNPITTDSNGEFSFYAADGRYQLTASGTGITERTVTDVLLADPDDGDEEQSAADVTFTPSGSGAVARDVQDKLRETLSPFDFGGVGDGTTNDSAAVLACSVAAVAQDKDVDFGGWTWNLGTQIALTTSHNGLTWRLRGGTIKKGFSGDLVTVTGTDNFSLVGNGWVDGSHGTYTGKGFVFSGDTKYPYFDEGIRFKDFTDSHIEFGADAGYYAIVNCGFQLASGQSDARMIHVNGPDTTAMQREINGSMNGYIDLDGSNATRIHSPLVTRVEISDACGVTIVTGTSWSNNGSAMTISGTTTIITGCRFAGNVTLDSDMTGVFAGNIQTAGTFTDNTTGGNVLVLHHPAGSASTNLCKNIFRHAPAAAEKIQTSRVTTRGDVDVSPLSVTGSGRTQIWTATLTQDRAAGLPTTGLISGDCFRIVRAASATGAFNLNVGTGPLKALGIGEWCEVETDGTSWYLTAYGSL